MIQTRLLMGMPIIVEILDKTVAEGTFEKIFKYFDYIDRKFSTFKDDSEISKINRKELDEKEASKDMKTIFRLAEKTKKDTDGYFDIVKNNGEYDPSGIVKGWAIYKAAEILWELGFKNFYINAGGDIQFSGLNNRGKIWTTGIKNPFNQTEIVKIVYLKGGLGIATSGNYIRGDHIYNPKNRKKKIDEIVSFTVIGPNVLEADRFATAVFAMGKQGIYFLEKIEGLAGYMIDKNGVAYMTTSFGQYAKTKNA